MVTPADSKLCIVLQSEEESFFHDNRQYFDNPHLLATEPSNVA